MEKEKAIIWKEALLEIINVNLIFKQARMILIKSYI